MLLIERDVISELPAETGELPYALAERDIRLADWFRPVVVAERRRPAIDEPFIHWSLAPAVRAEVDSEAKKIWVV